MNPVKADPSPTGSLDNCSAIEATPQQSKEELSAEDSDVLENCEKEFFDISDSKNPRLLSVKTERSSLPKKVDWGKYDKKFKSEWQNIPKLSRWLLPHPEDSTKAVCRYCRCIIRAHKTDLYKHCDTKKHTKSETTYREVHGDTLPVEESLVIPSVRPKKKRLKTEKLVNEDGSFFLVHSENGIFNRSNDDILVNLGEELISNDCDSIEINADEQEDFMGISDGITQLASRVGVVLTDDIEKMMRSQKNTVMQVLGCSSDMIGSAIKDKRNLVKMTRICVANLSKKYLIESAIEASRFRDEPLPSEPTNISDKLKNLEDKINITYSEMESLKLNVKATETMNK